MIRSPHERSDMRGRSAGENPDVVIAVIPGYGAAKHPPLT